jgi:hypothetical protein
MGLRREETMELPTPFVVPPNLPKLFGIFIGCTVVCIGCVFMIVGPGMVWAFASALCVGLYGVGLILAVVRQRPRVIIGSEGFEFQSLFGSRSHRWDQIDGAFTVIRIGLSKVVAYKLTSEFKARIGRMPTTRYSGYDEVLTGALEVRPRQLAELLNAHRQLNR